MEPARGERDDAVDVDVAGGGTANSPQWSPLVVSGMTTRCRSIGGRKRSPQWSPLVVSGMTSGRYGAYRRRPGPQWSPLVVSGMTVLDALPRRLAEFGRNGARSW